MDNSFQYIDKALGYINQLMLSYFLHNSETDQDTPESIEDAEVKSNLEEKIQDIQVVKNGVISTTSIWEVFGWRDHVVRPAGLRQDLLGTGDGRRDLSWLPEYWHQ